MRRKRIIIFVLIIVLVVIAVNISSLSKVRNLSKTDTYEMNFYLSLLHALEECEYVLIEDLVPVDWELMKVFTAYATKADKIDYAGYQYGSDLEDITHEDVISLIFIKDDRVVYYVDALVPRKFETDMISSTEVEFSLSEGITSKETFNSAVWLGDWYYESHISESLRQNKPYFHVHFNDKGWFELTLLDSQTI